MKHTLKLKDNNWLVINKETKEVVNTYMFKGEAHQRIADLEGFKIRPYLLGFEDMLLPCTCGVNDDTQTR